MGLISNLKQLNQNINNVEKYLAKGSEDEKIATKNLIKRGTCFVVYKINGETKFAPSRFLGYVYNELYKHHHKETDGRETNKVISKILESDPEANPQFEKEYFEYCHKLGFQANKSGSFGAPRKYWVHEHYVSKHTS